LRQGILFLGMLICVLLSLRRPFFGALVILVTFVLRDTLVVETYKLFYLYHCPQILYIATIFGVFMTRSGRIHEFFPHDATDWGMLGFLLVLVSSALVNGVDVLDHKYIDLFFKAVVLYFLLSRLADTPRRGSLVAWTLILATAFLAQLAWRKYRAGEMVYARPYYRSSFHWFGLQLVVTLPLIGAMIARRSKLLVRLALFALIPLFVLVALRTHSRSAYLGVGLGLAMLGWYYRRRWYLALAAVPIVAFAIVHQPGIVTARLESIWTGKTAEGLEDQSIQSRFEQMRTAMRVIASDPLLGIGPRQFFMEYDQYVSEEDASGGSYTMHSVPLLILCEEGLLGFAVFYGLIVLGALRDAVLLARRARDHPSLRPVAIVAAGAAMGFLAWLGYGLAQPQMWVINIWGTLALAAACRRVVDAEVAALTAEGQGAAQLASAHAAPVPAGAQTEIVFS